MRAAADVVHLLALDVHTADEHRVRPLEILRRGRAQVLVDETDLPVLWEVCSNQQQALRRHERLDAVGQGVGVLEGPERRRIARKDAEDTPCCLYALSSHQSTPKRPQI
jgi:hypothetical protein